MLPVHTTDGPLMTGAGCGAMVIVNDTVESHDNVLASVKVTDPLPTCDQLMVMLLLFVVITLPPVTTHV